MIKLKTYRYINIKICTYLSQSDLWLENINLNLPRGFSGSPLAYLMIDRLLRLIRDDFAEEAFLFGAKVLETILSRFLWDFRKKNACKLNADLLESVLNFFFSSIVDFHTFCCQCLEEACVNKCRSFDFRVDRKRKV